jgi:hypothetical protein
VAGTFWAWINGCHTVGLQPTAIILASLSYSTCLFIALTSRTNRKSTAYCKPIAISFSFGVTTHNSTYTWQATAKNPL